MQCIMKEQLKNLKQHEEELTKKKQEQVEMFYTQQQEVLRKREGMSQLLALFFTNIHFMHDFHAKSKIKSKKQGAMLTAAV